jgi:hypothetical protein
LPSIKRNIYESVEIFIRIVGLYLGVVSLYPCFKPLNFAMAFHSIIYIISVIINIVVDGKIHSLMCVDTYSLNFIHFLL